MPKIQSKISLIKWKAISFIIIMVVFFGNSIRLRADHFGLDLIGKYDMKNIRSIAIIDNYAYIGIDSGLLILDISNKFNPQPERDYSVLHSVVSISVSGKYAYIIDSAPDEYTPTSSSLRILDISDPSAPVQVGYYSDEESDPMRCVVVSGSYAYIGRGFAAPLASGGHLLILDVSNPAAPVFKSSIFLDYIKDIDVSGNYTYCDLFCVPSRPYGEITSRMNIVDISSPTSPHSVSEIHLFLKSPKFTLRNNLLFIECVGNVSKDSGIVIYDITHPDSPQWITSTLLPQGTPYDICQSGNALYLAGSFGVSALSLIPDHWITQGAYYQLAGNTTRIAAQGDYVFAGNDTDGFLIFYLNAPEINKPYITCDKTRLNFGASQDKTTPPQDVQISNLGEGTLDWKTEPDKTWIHITPAQGKGERKVHISVDPASLAPGSYHGTVWFLDPNTVNTKCPLEVYLTVYNPTTDLVSIGFFDTPENKSVVSGSIPVTGWALHPLGIESVKIYRDSVPGEPTGIIYIGDAVFIEGSRPDIEQTYSDYPFNYKGGWGYMLLTNFLPTKGNGPITLHAIATDVMGNVTALGSKTITLDNTHRVKPFGNIETPTQGGEASGKTFINWGWVLTPMPNKIPIDGFSIDIWIDGKNIGHPDYNIPRSDIIELFPGYANSNGALGYSYIDTTLFENGMHTIQWTAVDDAGNVDGIGSRYFFIRNETASTTPDIKTQAFSFVEENKMLQKSFDLTPVSIKRGYRLDSEAEDVYPDANGIICIEIAPLDRIEVAFISEPISSGLFEGYLKAGNQLKPLPVGSFLDRSRGVFYWQPGPGFAGIYNLVFMWKDLQGNSVQKNIKVVIDSRKIEKGTVE